MKNVRKNNGKGRNAVQRLLSLMLCLMLCAQLVPTTVLASTPKKVTRDAGTGSANLDTSLNSIDLDLGDGNRTVRDPETGKFVIVQGDTPAGTQTRDTSTFDLKTLNDAMTLWEEYNEAVLKDFDSRANETYDHQYGKEFISESDRLAYRWGYAFRSGELGTPGVDMFHKEVKGGAKGTAMKNTVIGSDRVSAKMEWLIDCLEAGGTVKNCSSIDTLKNQLRSYITELIPPLYNGCLNAGTIYSVENVCQQNETYLMKLMTQRPANVYEPTVEMLDAWNSETHKVIMLAQMIIDCAYTSNGRTVMSACGTETTTEAAKANMERYRQTIINCGSYDWDTDSAYDPVNRYKLSLDRYCQLCMEQGNTETAAASTVMTLNSIKSSEVGKLTAAANSATGGAKTRLETLISDVRATVDLSVAQLEVLLENDPSYITVEAMSYEDAKEKLDDAYAEVYRVLIAEIRDINNGAYGGFHEGFMSDAGSAARYLSSKGISKPEDVEPLLENLQEAMLVIVQGMDENGNPHRTKYAADLRNLLETQGRHFYLTGTLSELLAVQMADLYAGNLQIQNVLWTETNASVKMDVYYKFMSEEPSDDRLKVVDATLEGLEAVLRETAKRAAVQEITAAEGKNVKSMEDMVDTLRANADSKLANYQNLATAWYAMNYERFDREWDYSGYDQHGGRPSLDALLMWRTAEDAYQVYAPFAAAAESLPGITAAELKAYRSTLKTYRDVIGEWKENYEPFGRLRDYSTFIRNKLEDYCPISEARMSDIMDVLQHTYSDPALEENIRMLESYQTTRVSPYASEALKALSTQGMDVRSYLRVALAELRVWDCMMNYALGNNLSVYYDNYLYYAEAVASVSYDGLHYTPDPRLLSAVAGHEEVVNLYPLIHQYCIEAEGQYAAYDAGDDDIENWEMAEILQTDATIDEVEAMLITANEVMAAAAQEVSDCRKYLDNFVEAYGTKNDEYPKYLKDYQDAQDAYAEAQERCTTLQGQLIYAYLNEGRQIVTSVKDPVLTDQALNYLAGRLEELRQIVDVDAETTTLTELKQKMVELANNVAACRATLDNLEAQGITDGAAYDSAKAALTKAENEYFTASDAYKEQKRKMSGEIPEDEEDPQPQTGGEEPQAAGGDSVRLAIEEYNECVKESEILTIMRDSVGFTADSGVYPSFPTFSQLSELQLTRYINEYEDELDAIFDDTAELYDSLLTERAKYDSAGESEKLDHYRAMMMLAYSFADRYGRVESLYNAIARANDAMRKLHPPTSREEALERFESDFYKYYYAQRDYEEYTNLEYSLMQSELNLLRSGDNKANKAIWIKLYDAANNISARKEQLAEAAEKAKVTLLGDGVQGHNDYTAYYLSAASLAADSQLSAAQLRVRIQEIAEKKAAAEQKFKTEGDKLNRTVPDVASYGGVFALNPRQSALRQNSLNGMVTNEALLNYVAVNNSESYIQAYLEYQLAIAENYDPANTRQLMMERMEALRDQYALQVDTGAKAGTDKILFFEVTYQDMQGIDRREYLFPTLDANEKTSAKIKELTANAALVNQSHVDTMALLGQAGGTVGDVKSLSSWGTDTFLFTTQYKMDETKPAAFRIFCENVHTDQNAESGDGNSWSCVGMRLYHVDDVFGHSAYGYGGSDAPHVKLEFKGQQIAALKMGECSLAWSCAKMMSLDTMAEVQGMDNNIYPYQTEKIGEGSAAGKIMAKSDAESEYLFKLDFADVYGAGVEPLVTRFSDNQCAIKDLGLSECLMFNLVYKDMNDCRKQVRVPVITSSLAWAVDHLGGDAENQTIFGYAQQGDSLMFSAYLPDMKTLLVQESTLCFEAVDWAPSGKCSQTCRSNIAERKDTLNSIVSVDKYNENGERISVTEPADKEILLTGIQIYAPGTYETDVRIENGVIMPAVEGTPAYFDVAANSTGDSYAYGEKVRLSDLMSNYSPEMSLKPVDNEKKYMVIISTDFTSLSATAESPQVTVEYVSTSGRLVSSATEDVGSTSRDYYGYWPGINNTDITAQRATGQSGQLKMLFSINDLYYFSDVKIKMASTARDDWQISGITIWELSSLSKRQGTWTPVTNSVGEILSDRSYDREMEGTILVEKTDKVLIQPGDEKKIYIHGDNAQVVEEQDIDWEANRYYMDIDTAMSDLGFNKGRANYSVKVKVAGESNSNTIDGDCGSVNPFYFQLVFANGKSGYVLANQQLSGDGFRTGFNETFTIPTNRDYGELRAVRIIPDDTSSESKIFDKLNIESIEVSQQGNNAVNRTWVINDVGWIEIDYHDDAETYTVSGRKGRAEGDLARNFNVSYSTYSTKLLFMISTGQADATTDSEAVNELTAGMSAAEAQKIKDVMTYNPQFQGEVSMNLTYRDSKGNIQHDTFDMVHAIAAYANKKITTQESTNEQGDIVQSETISDTSYMFREGHMDRFELEVRDVQRLLNASIIATGVADQSCFWKIESFAVGMIKEDGTLNINKNNEYEKTNAATAEKLCEGNHMPFTMWIPARHTEEIQFSFSENTIDVDLENQTWEVAATRVPDSDNDVANIYVYLDDVSNVPSTLMARIKYTNSHGQAYQTALRKMEQMGEKAFVATNVDVGGMAVMNSLMLDTLDAGISGVMVDRVVIQQVRSDVVINTYTCVPGAVAGTITGGVLYVYPGGGSGSGSNVTLAENRQVVTLGFGAETETARLVAENRDIAVAIRYTTNNDSSGREFNSPYIYLTDQQIESIAAGGTAQITFREPYVSKIKGLQILATGKLKAELQCAAIGTYTKASADEEEVCTGWYSFSNFDKALNLTAASRLITPSSDHTMEGMRGRANTVSPMTIEITTGALGSAVDPQTLQPIKMVVQYMDAQNSSRSVTYNDIRSNLIEGGFKPGETAKIRVMLVGAAKLKSITIEPYSADTAVTSTDDWYISSYVVNMNLDREVYSYTAEVNRSAVQGSPLILRPAGLGLKIEAQYMVPGSDGQDIVRVVSNESSPIKLVVAAGREVIITASLTGSLTPEDYTLRVLDANGNSAAETVTKTSIGYVFKTAAAGTYDLMFAAADDETVSDIVTITVLGGDTQTPSEASPTDMGG